MSENKISQFGKNRKLILVLLGGALGIFLLILSGVGWDGGKKEEKTEPMATMDSDAYAEKIREEIRTLCLQVQGVESVSVAVTLKGGYRAVYATDAQNTANGYKQNTVLIGSGSSEEAVFIGYENPEIGGIGIVCRGASDPLVRDRIVSLVSAAFGVGSNKIYVAVGAAS